MYDEELNKLIEMALMDGVLTEKEKQILFKKAESFGIDLDEFEMVLEAKLFERQQILNQETASVYDVPKSDKFGDVKKCPSCGAIVQPFQTKCTNCGHNFSNIKSAASIQTFFEKFGKINYDVKVEPSITFGKGLFDTSDIDDEQKRKQMIYERQKDFISQFPIPNTKEDILEFLSMAIPLAKKFANKSKFSKAWSNSWNAESMGFKNYEYLLSKVWYNKCEQIIMKARFAMKEDKRSLEEINYYAKALNIK
jgi:phosphopantetheinyl transferase (holo-ACP synthase)